MTKLIRIENANNKDLESLIAFMKSSNMSFEVGDEDEFEPNEDTLEAFEDTKNGKVNRYNSVDDLFDKYIK